MTEFPDFERYEYGRHRYNKHKPTSTSVIIALIGLVVVTIICIILSIGSSAGIVEAKMTGYRTEDDFVIIEIENKSSSTSGDALSYCFPGKTLMQRSAKTMIQIQSEEYDFDISTHKTWYLVENNEIRVPVDDITNEITIRGTKSSEKILLVKNETTGEWETPSIWKKLSYAFKFF